MTLAIRPARPGDEAAILGFVHALAAHVGEAAAVKATVADLRQALFAAAPAAHALMVEAGGAAGVTGVAGVEAGGAGGVAATGGGVPPPFSPPQPTRATATRLAMSELLIRVFILFPCKS